MAGNVPEWVRDYYGEDYYRFTPEVDPEGPGHGEIAHEGGGVDLRPSQTSGAPFEAGPGRTSQPKTSASG